MMVKDKLIASKVDWLQKDTHNDMGLILSRRLLQLFVILQFEHFWLMLYKTYRHPFPLCSKSK